MAEADTSVVINVQSATQNATAYLQSLGPFMGGQISDVRLEEVELSEDERFWFVTLGFDRSVDKALVPFQTSRDYKQFKVDAVTGDVKSMKIRTL